MSFVWVNVDNTSNYNKNEKDRCTFHDPGCHTIPRNLETDRKGSEMKIDGGWRKFNNDAEALEYCRKEHPNHIIKHCGICRKRYNG